LTSATGNTIGLRSLAKIGKTPVTGPMFPALRRKLKNCCALKTKAYVRYAQEECGSKLLTNLCAAPNGYEPRFGHEGLGADKHFPKSPCIAQAWTKFELLTLAEKNKKAQELSLKFLEKGSSGLQQADVELDGTLTDIDLGLTDAIEGEEGVSAGAWTLTPTFSRWTHSPTAATATAPPTAATLDANRVTVHTSVSETCEF